jgi:hypothetical protein
MATVVSHDVVISLEKKLPPGGKTILANRLNITQSAVYMMFSGDRKMKKEYFDEAIKIIDEYRFANKQCAKLLKKI